MRKGMMSSLREWTPSPATAWYSKQFRFSVTKWIHLNGGDNGLIRFFTRVYTALRPGGAFVLEPQEWETYSKAKRLDSVSLVRPYLTFLTAFLEAQRERKTSEDTASRLRRRLGSNWIQSCRTFRRSWRRR